MVDHRIAKCNNRQIRRPELELARAWHLTKSLDPKVVHNHGCMLAVGPKLPLFRVRDTIARKLRVPVNGLGGDRVSFVIKMQAYDDNTRDMAEARRKWITNRFEVDRDNVFTGEGTLLTRQ